MTIHAKVALEKPIPPGTVLSIPALSLVHG
jgi:hypothetical protein